MTYLTKDIRDHLVASTVIQNSFSDRIYPEVIPQGVASPYPCVIINDLTNEPEYCLRGEVGTHTANIQIDVWTDGSGGKAKANEFGELIRNRLSGFRGTFGTGCYGTARLIRNNSVAAPPADASDIHRRRVSMDFEIIHSADVPTLA